jgi:hypothetical protein
MKVQKRGILGDVTPDLDHTPTIVTLSRTVNLQLSHLTMTTTHTHPHPHPTPLVDVLMCVTDDCDDCVDVLMPELTWVMCWWLCCWLRWWHHFQALAKWSEELSEEQFRTEKRARLEDTP